MSARSRKAVPTGKPVAVDTLLASLAPPTQSEVAASPPPADAPTDAPADAPTDANVGAPELAAPEEPLVHLAEVPPADPYLPGFAMIDDPDELPLPGASTPQGLVTGEAAPPQSPRGTLAAQPKPLDIVEDRTLEQLALDGDILPAYAAGLRTGVRYESRIRVLEAYQYPGNLKEAPEWVDRNWTGYADYDPLRGIEPGPALRVPTRHGDTVALCRPGDYCVKQSVLLAHGIEPDIVIEVWPKESFEKNFLPALAKPPQAPAPPFAPYESA